jgi:hypothetical protein
MKRSIQERFWSKVDVKDELQCWNWLGSPNAGGYGTIIIYGKIFLAHRLSWELAHGESPGGYLVRHTCDNPICVNPNHLIIGTDWDNIHDRCIRFRDLRIRHLTFDQVSELRTRYPLGETTNDLAKEFGVKVSTIWQALTGRTWKWHPTPPVTEIRNERINNCKLANLERQRRCALKRSGAVV